ncbi:hypothetical protein KIW84_022949 [Lathyrus oleraceus]|uniref:Uncharacterized protein n=1 Tax=Pisum sativum TaxID=3888 RepID=A0A9D5B7A4_PEA|nr:hypothetical protein KIW84_022949 [Pisum sativum]
MDTDSVAPCTKLAATSRKPLHPPTQNSTGAPKARLKNHDELHKQAQSTPANEKIKFSGMRGPILPCILDPAAGYKQGSQIMSNTLAILKGLTIPRQITSPVVQLVPETEADVAPKICKRNSDSPGDSHVGSNSKEHIAKMLLHLQEPNYVIRVLID